jgi:1-acyl-sn-glycerol-3-phosphate acyltransferase
MSYTVRSGTIEVADRRTWLRAGLSSAVLLRAAPSVGASMARRSPDRRHAAERLWARAVRRALLVDLTVEGLAAVDPAEPYVVVATHEGLFDPVALMHLPLNLRFAVRSEIFGWRDVGRYLTASAQVAVDPESGRASFRRLVNTARRAFEAGESIAVFAQGSLVGIEAAFHPGAFRLAAITGRRILPVVLTGTHRVWEHPFRPTLRLGQPVGMRILAPLTPGADAEAECRLLSREMKAHALDGTMPAPRRYRPIRDGFWDDYRFEIDPEFPDVADLVAAHRRSANQGSRGVSPNTAFGPSPPAA